MTSNESGSSFIHNSISCYSAPAMEGEGGGVTGWCIKSAASLETSGAEWVDDGPQGQKIQLQHISMNFLLTVFSPGTGRDDVMRRALTPRTQADWVCHWSGQGDPPRLTSQHWTTPRHYLPDSTSSALACAPHTQKHLTVDNPGLESFAPNITQPAPTPIKSTATEINHTDLLKVISSNSKAKPNVLFQFHAVVGVQSLTIHWINPRLKADE